MSPFSLVSRAFSLVVEALSDDSFVSSPDGWGSLAVRAKTEVPLTVEIIATTKAMESNLTLTVSPEGRIA
jgi:hypothetical protein